MVSKFPTLMASQRPENLSDGGGKPRIRDPPQSVKKMWKNVTVIVQGVIIVVIVYVYLYILYIYICSYLFFC